MKTIEELKNTESVYENSFCSKEDVASHFCIELGDEVHIVYAEYDCPPYEGYAFVLCIINNRLYEVHGSHCSCFGLENQWELEEVDIESLAYRVVNGHGLVVNCATVIGLSEEDIVKYKKG